MKKQIKKNNKQDIITKTEAMIIKLQAQKPKNILAFKKRRKNKEKINILKTLLAQKKYNILENWLKKNKEIDKKQTPILLQVKNNLKVFWQNFHWPVYSRIKQWKKRYQTRDLRWRLVVLFVFVLLCLSLIIIGVFGYINNWSFVGDSFKTLPLGLITVGIIGLILA